MEPKWQSTNLDTAWKLATSAVIAPGDATTAFELASEVLQANETPSTRTLDVQAASLATIGRFDEAVVVCRKALMPSCTRSNLADCRTIGAIRKETALHREVKRFYKAKLNN